MPEELIMLGYIEKFGTQAIYGRPLSARETRGMVLTENVVKAYRERQATSDWVTWAKNNPDKAEMLNEAMQLWQTLT